jgi:hypothetical protein
MLESALRRALAAVMRGRGSSRREQRDDRLRDLGATNDRGTSCCGKSETCWAPRLAEWPACSVRGCGVAVAGAIVAAAALSAAVATIEGEPAD